MLRRIKNKLRCDKRGKPKQNLPASNGHGVPASAGPDHGNEPRPSPQAASPESLSNEKSPDPVPSDSTRDLWKEALEGLPIDTQRKLKAMGLGQLSSASMGSEIDDLVNLAKEKQDKCEERFWRIPRDDGDDIIVRDYAARVIGWLQQTGDIVVQFAPPQASVPWAVIKSVMQIPVIEDEQMCALLASIEKISRIINRGQVYELVYKPETTPEDALKNFYAALETLYGTALTLLAESTTLFSAGTAKRTLNAILSPGKVPHILSDLVDQENDLAREVQACEGRRSALVDDRLMDTLQALDAPLARVDENVRGLLQLVDEKDRIELLEWISSIPFGTYHNTTKDKRTPNTGEWLIRHKKFCIWEDISSSKFFWLQGSPGTGKTFLASKAIDHLQDVLEKTPNDEGFAFFYCDRTDPIRTQPLSILQSFVRQLSTPISNPESMQTKLREACMEARINGSNLSYGACKQQLLESFNLYPRTTLVIDGLDECDQNSRADIIDTLRTLLSEARKPLKIFISSRPDVDIQWLLDDSIQVSVQATDSEDDVKKHLDEELERLVRILPVFRSLEEDKAEKLRNDIAETLLARCQGMFQWVAVQIQQLTKCNTPDAIETRLRSLPGDLKTTYDEIYREIQDLEDSEKALACRAFQWVMAAFRPLSTDELLSAIRVERNGEELHFASEINESILLSISKNLLVLDSELQVWRFPHLSVAEYLQAKDGFSLQEAHGLCANVCIPLLINTYEEYDPDDEAGQPVRSEKFLDTTHPFQVYTRYHWLSHVQAASSSDAILVSNLKTFLGSPNKSSLEYQRWYRQCVLDGWYKRPPSSFLASLSAKDLAPATVSVFLMCKFSLFNVLRDWWESPEIDLSLKNEGGENLLVLGAMAGCKPICKSLLDRGFPVDAPVGHINYDSVLAAAAYTGQAEIAKLLIKEGGADVNRQLENGVHGSALAAAIENGHLNVVKYLVKEAGADANMLIAHGDYTSALGAAAYKGNLQITKFLVQQAGADANLRQMTGRNPLFAFRSQWMDSVLAIAAGEGHFEIVKFLVLKAGADVNMALHGEQGGSALAAAAESMHKHTEMVKFLVEEGKADVNMPLEGPNGNALVAAASRERSEVVRYLVQEAGADVNMPLPTGRYGSVLAATVDDGSLELVKFLVQEGGADVNMLLPTPSSSQGGSALAVASFKGRIDIVRYLVGEAHADVNMQLTHPLFASALAAAAARRQMEVVKYLVEEAGADVNMQLENGFFGSALASVAFFAEGETEVIEYLVRKGADVNAPLRNGDFGSALAAAIGGGEDDVAKWLIEANADVNQKLSGGKYGSALAVASFWGLVDCAELLVRVGAGVNLSLENKAFGNALQAAEAEWSDDNMELLTLTGGTALVMISDKEGVAELLRKHGAEA